MTPDIKVFLLCPIPEDQKPINSYIGFKENFLTNWTTLSTKKFFQSLRLTYLFFFTICLIFSLNDLFFIIKSTNSIYLFFNWLVIKIFLSFLFLFIYFNILLFRLTVINSNLKNPRVFYEEASWFDGQIWEKPFFLIKNDKLISSQKLEPIIQRLFRINSICLLILLGFFTIL